MLNGYGGFAISESPVWMPNVAAWCAEGGVWAIAGLRGGLEHGEAWHRAGRREHKQHVFDDFHAAADWLVATGRPSRSARWRVARTVGCSSGRRSPSAPISPGWCGARCRCSTWCASRSS
ncbi:MAG: prolyl oligopeptidase family serine peptidase [Ilumatobacteraceae bacterium]